MSSRSDGIRPAGVDDLPQVAALMLHSRRSTAGIPPAVHSEHEVLSWLRDVVLPTCDTWLSTDPVTREVSGVLVLADGWIEQLYIAVDHQRLGHGARLVALAKESSASLQLWTFTANAGARRFYETQGFAAVGEVSSDNEEGRPAIRYHWYAG